MVPHVCQLLLVFLNGCNNITSIFPQVTNNSNSNETYQIQSSGCNCSCTNFPNILNLCSMSNVRIPSCATTVSDAPEPSLLSTTPGLMTLSSEDDDGIFNDQARRKNKTTKIPTTSASTTISNPITSTLKSTSILVTDNQMTPSPPDSFNQQKDKLSTQITIDATEFSTTPSSPVGSTTNKPPLVTISTFAVSKSLTEKITVAERSTTSPRPTTHIDRESSTENELTTRSDGATTSLEEHVSPSDQSSTSQSISTTQPATSNKTSESSVSSSTTPMYQTSKVPEKNPSPKDDSDNTSTTKSSSTSALYTAATTTTFRTSTTDKESTTAVDYIRSTQKTDREKVTTPLFTITKTSTTLSSNDRSTSSLSDTTGSSIQTEIREKARSTTVEYLTTDAPTLITQYDQTPTDLTVKPSVNDDVTLTTSYRTTLLPIMTTTENEEILNDKASKKKNTTKILTTLEPFELSSTPYPMSRAASELTTESPDIITTTWSTTDFVSTTQPSNDSNCDLTDQTTDKSIEPMNNTELTSLRRVKRSLFSYGTELSKILLQNDKSNVALSPINFALLLVMVRSGCRSPMKEEFNKILNLTPNPTDNRLQLFKSIVDSMNNIINNANVEVYMANKMYLPKDVVVNPRFMKLTRIIFQSEPQTIDFHDMNSTLQQLNKWSINSTKDKISVLTDSNRLDSSTSVLLTSVAYLSGNWSYPFDRQFTSKNLFYLDDGTKKKVCTMIQVNKFRYGELPNLKAEFVMLPFESGDNNSLSMIIMLPTNGTNLNTVAESLNNLTSSQLTDNSSVEVVELSLPKFRIESVIDLAENPEKFGLKNVTNYSDDFKCIVKAQPLQISHIIQKTVINVHEGGCWKVPVNYVCPQEERSCNNTSSIKFVVNQPFIILVVNSDMILFSGRVNDPSAKSINTKV